MENDRLYLQPVIFLFYTTIKLSYSAGNYVANYLFI